MIYFDEVERQTNIKRDATDINIVYHFHRYLIRISSDYSKVPHFVNLSTDLVITILELVREHVQRRTEGHARAPG